MALITSFAVLLATALFALVSAAFGHRLLRLLGIEFSAAAEQLLFSIALGVICIEILLFPVQLLNHIRAGVAGALLLAVAVGSREFAAILKKLGHCRSRAFNGSRTQRNLLILLTLVVALEGFAAMAPLTGSDALHYHFTAPLLVLHSGFHANFFLSHSFFSGQSHLLILAGLALGGSQLAMGFLFLGGVLAAGAGCCLARRWVSLEWSTIVALLFLLTPVVIWQISTAGAPDLWMAFFATMSVMAIARSAEWLSIPMAILAGALAGAIAGAKYTGCIVAASIAVAYFLENRSIRRVAIFFLSALCAGIWPYARNFAWTGDPFFPFLLSRISPGTINAFALASYRADTGASTQKGFWQVLGSPVFAGIDPLHAGLWQFLGPIVLVFFPFLFFTLRKTPAWRAALTIWIVSALSIGATSGMTRFLLPVLPIALAAVMAGAARAVSAGLRPLRFVTLATIGFFCTLGGAGVLVYLRSPLSAAVGLTSKENYLRQRAPEYQAVEFVNQILAKPEPEGNTLVFLRHVFYLRVPFLYGNPAASWAIDPSRYKTPEEWMELFREQNVRWVVRSPEFPSEIAAPLDQLEAQGKLIAIARAEVADFQGMRISEERMTVPIAILKFVP